MKRSFPCLLLVWSLLACNDGSDAGPDVSGISVDLPVSRFDQDFFNLDTNRLGPGLSQLQSRHEPFYSDFMQQILGVDGSDSSAQTRQVVNDFISGYKPIFDSLQRSYREVDDIEKGVEKQMRYVKHYFPRYEPGKLIFYVGPFDAPGVASTSGGPAIGLQQFAGRNFSVYHMAPVQEMFPSYITRRFSREYIMPNIIKAVAADLYPDQAGGKPLIEQMVEKGKLWWLSKKFMPGVHDSLITGFTGNQVRWCEENEGLIWTYFVKNEDLYSVNPVIIQTYIGEGPFTQGFSQEYSPGNLGPWIGWQIIKKYEEKNPSLGLDAIMRKPAREIVDEARYKPR